MLPYMVINFCVRICVESARSIDININLTAIGEEANEDVTLYGDKFLSTEIASLFKSKSARSIDINCRVTSTKLHHSSNLNLQGCLVPSPEY